ncbi:MAG: response regulator [Deltaproteobacteria bacterium]|jgi:YD repeat-containing protein|nr:response regulator [Deltaproteobacteria bacterium]
MSFRWKVFLVSVAITVALLGTIVGVCRYFIRDGIQVTIANDLSIMAKLAENLVSSDMKLIKAKAWTAAHELDGKDRRYWPAIMERQVESNPLFLSMTVFTRQGILAVYGSPPTTSKLMASPYAQKAFEGLTVFTPSQAADNGELVFHIFTPIDTEKIASIAIPGLYFTDLLKDFQIWETGSVFVVDNDGKILANKNVERVRTQYNVFKDPRKEKTSVKTFGEFLKRMIRGGEGQGSYILDDKERLVYFIAISDSNVGWSLGVTAPLVESPLTYVDQGVFIMTLVFLAVGVLFSWLISGFVERQFDIINKQYNNLSEMSEIARRASEAKTAFLANMSHEMRTPLNAIIGFSDLMLCGRYDAKESLESLDKVHSAGLILLGIVNDILDISKIEEGRLELFEVEYELTSLVNDAVAVNLIRIGAKPIEFHVAFDPTLPSRLIGDELRIKQICSNLLSNAFKYTQSGRVDLVVGGKIEGDFIWLSIKVKDTGIGIKKDDLSKLFSDYGQVDIKSNRKIEGTGLGLSITKKMVEMMDGHIEVTSEYGHGSTFIVVIRQKISQSASVGEKPGGLGTLNSLRAETQARLRRNVIPMPYARILLVDDVQANLDVAKGILKPYGMRIDCVTCGQAAVDLIRAAEPRYNAIFMDHMMPGMDGIEAVRLIRREIGTDYAQKIPIIALTANAIVGNEKLFLENGFQAYLTKPVDILRMDQVLKRLVRDKSQEAQLPSLEVPVEAALEELEETGPALDLPGVSVAEALERFGGDRAVYFEVLKSYVNSVEELTPKLEKPSPERLKDYTITVHGLKSSSYGVGANVVGDLARDLEARSNAGDLEFVLAHNDNFLAEVDLLVAEIRSLLAPEEKPLDRPRRPAPDPAALERLRRAAEAYNMDEVEEALRELEAYSYDSQGQLVTWLRERAERTSFEEIAARLAPGSGGQAASKAAPGPEASPEA